MDDSELRQQYRSWVKSPSGVGLMRYLQEQFSIAIDTAVDSPDLQRKALELQSAQAYKTIRTYVERMSTEP